VKPFPPASELSFLIGSELSSVALASYQIELSFSEGHLLVVEHGLEYENASGERQIHDPQVGMAQERIAFHELIGERIIDMHVEPWRLLLKFAGNRTLVVLATPGPFESGHLWFRHHDAGGCATQEKLIVF